MDSVAYLFSGVFIFFFCKTLHLCVNKDVQLYKIHTADR